MKTWEHFTKPYGSGIFRATGCRSCWLCGDCMKSLSYNGNVGNYVDHLFSVIHQRMLAEQIGRPTTDLLRAGLGLVLMVPERAMPLSWVESLHGRELMQAIAGIGESGCETIPDSGEPDDPEVSMPFPFPDRG